MTEDLRVDTGLVREAGGRLQEIAADLPEPPAVHRPTGPDALSAAIAAKVAEVVDPVVAQMPTAKHALTQYAQKVINAAGIYDAADRQVAEEILKRVDEFDDAFGGASPGGAGSGAASGAAADATFGSGAASPAARATQRNAQLGPMMQMAQQVTQAPMQLAGLAGPVPEATQQGVGQAVQLVGQLSEIGGEGETQLPDGVSTEGAAVQSDTVTAGEDPGNRIPESLAAATQPPERTDTATAAKQPGIAL